MNKNLVSTAVAGALGLTVALPAVASHDHTVLVPYVVKDANRTTVVTLIGHLHTDAPKGQIHIQYWTKSTTDANTAACKPSSVYVPFTDNDMLTFDTAGILGYPLFGDSTNPAPLGMAISYPGPVHGYMVASGATDVYYQGYWMELDLANGGAQGDWTLGDDWGIFLGEGNGFAYNGNFTDFEPGTVLKSTNNWGSGFGTNRSVPFWPTSVASTAFTVTPLGSEMLTKENNQVILQVQNDDGVQGAYDRNENGVDGTVPITVRCVGRVTPNQLMPGVVTNAAWAAQGGWGFLRNLGNNDNAGGYAPGCFAPDLWTGYGSVSSVCWQGTGYIQQDRADLDALVYQVDSSSVGGKFMTNATRIVTEQDNRSFAHDFFLD